MKKTLVKIKVLNEEISFERAKAMAQAVASVYTQEPMLVAWYDRKMDRFFPQVTCCDLGDGRPTWEIYADSRGAKIKVDVNESDYVFLFV